MANVLEVLDARILDTDFTDGNAQTLHQVDGIIISTVGGAKTRHGNTYDILTVAL